LSASFPGCLNEVGKLYETGDPWEPYRLLDPAGGPVQPVELDLMDLLASHTPATTLIGGPWEAEWLPPPWPAGVVVRGPGRHLHTTRPPRPSVRSAPPCASTVTTTQPPAADPGIERTHSSDLAFDALPQSCAAW
jgi:hypothetical protein